MMKHKFIAKAVGALALLVLATAPARAQLYNNGTPNGSSGNEMTEWIQAEDFSLGSGSTLTGVTFWALYGAAGYQGSVNWQIYGNNAGVPGSVLFSGLVTPTTTTYPAAACCGYTTGIQLDFALPSIDLGAGTYWLGLHNGPLGTTARNDFYWASTNTNSTSTAEENDVPYSDNSWFNNGVEHAFQLSGSVDNASVTPEPATMALMATGLVGLTGGGMFRRRRKSA